MSTVPYWYEGDDAKPDDIDNAVERISSLQDALEAATDERDTAHAALRVCAALLVQSKFTEAERRTALSVIAKALPEDES